MNTRTSRSVYGDRLVPLETSDEREQEAAERDELDTARDQYRYYRLRCAQALKKLYGRRRAPRAANGEQP